MPVGTYVRGRPQAGPKRAFLAIPTGSGDITAPCVASVVAALPALADAGIAADFMIEAGNCHVDDARNGLVREFLRTDCTDLVFIDADVGFAPEALVALLSCDRDVVAGVYPKKEFPASFPVFVGSVGPLWAGEDGAVEVEGAPTGFMRIKRKVLEALCETAVSFRGQNPDDDGLYHVIFERGVGDGHRWSGDYFFCRKWREAGGKIHVLPELRFTHTGAYTWGGTLGDYWRDKHGLNDQALARAVEKLRAGFDKQAICDLHRAYDNPWAADPLFLASAYILAREARTILDCGSGLTTLVLALANPSAEIHSLEHDPIWATQTREMLDRFGVDNVELHCNPLKDHADGRWYGCRGLPAEQWDLAVNDGPPRTKADRTALYRLFQGRISTVLADDTQDPEHLAALSGWAIKTNVEAGFSIARRALRIAA